MENVTSLPLASLLCCLLAALHLSQAEKTPLGWDNNDSEGIVKPWTQSPEDDAEVRRAFASVRSTHGTPSGKYWCETGTDFLIHSPNFPDYYPRGVRQRWIFKSGSDTMIKVHCPRIRIHPTRRCRKDKLITFSGPPYTRGVRRCGRIDDYRATFYDNVKLAFKSNWDSAVSTGFYCTVQCEAIPTTTTTFSPLCPHPAFPPSMPTPIASCSEIPAEYSSVCNCTECSGKMSLTCNFCDRCDFDLFALYDFSLELVLEPHFTCPSHPMDISGYFFHNADNIVAARFCLEEDMSHITFPFAELVNLATLAYQDCNNTLIDICSVSRSLPPRERSSGIPSARAVYTVTLPGAEDIPNVVNLYLHDVDLDVDNETLSCPNLQFISIDSDGVELMADAFAHITAIRELIVRMCQDTIVEDTFRLSAANLVVLTIDDTCVHNIAEGSVKFEDVQTGSNHELVMLTFTASGTLFEYIPVCPFRQLLKMNFVDLIWTTELKCRNCGGTWYWGLTAGQKANITSTCFDTLSNQAYPLSTYITNNGNPCGFSVPDYNCY